MVNASVVVVASGLESARVANPTPIQTLAVDDDDKRRLRM